MSVIVQMNHGFATAKRRLPIEKTNPRLTECGAMSTVILWPVSSATGGGLVNTTSTNPDFQISRSYP